MILRDLRFLLIGLAPITLVACIDTHTAAAPQTSMAPAIGVDLGNSSRVPHIAQANRAWDYSRAVRFDGRNGPRIRHADGIAVPCRV